MHWTELRATTVAVVNLAAVLERGDEQLLPAVYRWIGSSFAISPTQLGLLSLARAAMQAVCSPLGGIAGHVFHRGRVIGAGCCIWAAATAAFATCSSLAAGLPLWALNGLGLALVLPNSQSLIADLFPAAARGRAFGLLYLVAALGGMLGALFATNLGAHRPLGLEGWRFAFGCMAVVSVAAGAANFWLARDPNLQAISTSSTSALPYKQVPAAAVGDAAGEDGMAPHGGSPDAEEAGELEGQQTPMPGRATAKPAGAAAARALAAERSTLGEAGREMLRILRVPTFLLIVAQGVFGSLPWAAFVFLTLYFQLLGMNDAAASLLVALFLGGTAFGGLLGGVAGDAAAERWPRHGRLAVCQFSVAIGLPFAVLVTKGLPRDGRPGTVALYAVVLVIFALLKAWPAPAFNNPAFAEVVPARQRSLIFSLDRALEGALAAFAAPLVGLLASRVFGFSGHASVTHDRATDLANAEALGSALLTFMLVPWTVTLLLYSVLHFYYPADRLRAAEREAAALDEMQRLVPAGPKHPAPAGRSASPPWVELQASASLDEARLLEGSTSAEAYSVGPATPAPPHPQLAPGSAGG